MTLTINEIRKKTVAVGTDAKSAARWVRSGGEKRAYGDCVASKIEITQVERKFKTNRRRKGGCGDLVHCSYCQLNQIRLKRLANAKPCLTYEGAWL